MRVTYDPDADAGYIYLTDTIAPGESKKQLQVKNDADIVIDIDKDGYIIGIELLRIGLLHPTLRAQVDVLNLSDEEKKLCRHALGLPNAKKKSYRNHFVTSKGGRDAEVFEVMHDKGLVLRQANNKLLGSGDVFYRLTRAAAAACLEPGERLDQTDFAYRR